ncbi:glucose dehydrogenase [FAD, quinone]-like [Athalia rosae]|uniref:glucose dehydrogenase [FAD, quinone]-like n=1 Tax=Athalia rosae TaxID=37344 RepID=UPI0020347C33|nr:glucose dehydrogenase [FAD, quinone]-like [Athalia rosae]
MDVDCAYSALSAAIDYGHPLGYMVFLNVLIKLLRPDIVDKENQPKITAADDLAESYDFVVIGAGAAGAVIANRLTENSNWTVLLLEAGGEEPVISDVPATYLSLQSGELDWNFKAEPSSTYCKGMTDNRCRIPKGKVLGGSSTTNAMIYVRGNSKDYDEWRDQGNPGWGYEDVLPYFIKSENVSIPELRNSPYHGTGGYLGVEYFKHSSDMEDLFLQASRELGYDVIDANGKSQSGFMKSQITLKNGLKCSTSKAFLRTAAHRKNLFISTDSLVHKILIDEKTKTAYGVKFRRGEKMYTVNAKREVILSAGAIQSPQLLMLSGIGPKKHLKEMGIPVIHDLPGVGENYQDHVLLGGLVYLMDAPPVDTYRNTTNPATFSAAKRFLEDHDGPMYDLPGAGAMGFVSTKYSTPDYPDVQLVYGPRGDNQMGSFFAARAADVRKDTYNNLFEGLINHASYRLPATILRPKSRGYVKLKDANPEHYPIIVPNYFSDPQDLEVLVEGTLLAYKFSQTPTMQRFKPRLNRNPISPECAKFPYFSKNYLRCHARYYPQTAEHPSSTCKMGPAYDDMAVVDSRLRVYGIKRLRVVDSSIMPTIVSGNTYAPAVMIGEKGADMIKEDLVSSNDMQSDAPVLDSENPSEYRVAEILLLLLKSYIYYKEKYLWFIPVVSVACVILTLCAAFACFLYYRKLQQPKK